MPTSGCDAEHHNRFTLAYQAVTPKLYTTTRTAKTATSTYRCGNSCEPALRAPVYFPPEILNWDPDDDSQAFVFVDGGGYSLQQSGVLALSYGYERALSIGVQTSTPFRRHRTSHRVWAGQQVIEAFAERDAKHYLLRDRDSIYGPPVWW